MKINFKSAWALMALLLVGIVPARMAQAEEVYFTQKSLLEEFFAGSKSVSYKQFDLTDPALAARVRQRLGYTPAKQKATFYVALDAQGQVDGYAFIDEELGQHLPITFGVKLSPTGMVERLEILVYRESRGDEIRDARFKKQFAGKTSTDALRLNVDVAAISGATISSSSMAVGVKRAVVLFEECLRPPRIVGQASP
jgi:Na+-translocating ferredoxin:NAD+ oxidoreductase subunit G